MKGFSVVEILITISIFILLGVVSLMQFSSAGQVQDARRGALEFISRIREMQRRTLSGSRAPDAQPPVLQPKGGFGIRISDDGRSYTTVVAKKPIQRASSLTYDAGSAGASFSPIATYTLPNAKQMTLGPPKMLLLFTQPKGVLCLCEDSSNCTATNSRCGLCREFASVDPPVCAVGATDLPLTTASNQGTTVPVTFQGSIVARVSIDLVGSRFTVE